MRVLIVILTVLAAVPAAAQISSRPTDPPLVTAVNESWYQLREPLQFAGELYFPAGASVFFNGNSMVRTGHYNGVPLYADTTVESHSIVLVPIGRAPSFPVQVAATATSVRAAAVPPTGLPLPAGAVSVFTSDAVDREAPPVSATLPVRAPAARETVGTSGFLPAAAPRIAPLVSLRRPDSNDGVWITYAGGRYVSAGIPVAFDGAAFTHVGEHGTFPVFSRGGQQDVIYLPTSRAGVVAPYRLKE